MFNDLIQEEGTLYPFIRFALSRPVNGKAAPKVQVPLDPNGNPWVMLASVQKVKTFELMNLAEGLRARELRTVFTPTQLQIAEPKKGTLSDQFVYKGNLYEVVQREDWTEYDLGYFKFYVAKVED